MKIAVKATRTYTLTIQELCRALKIPKKGWQDITLSKAYDKDYHSYEHGAEVVTIILNDSKDKTRPIP